MGLFVARRNCPPESAAFFLDRVSIMIRPLSIYNLVGW